MTPAGFPHSDISGSTPACDSPKLFAANHVLHRLLTPRHSPCARSSLVTNFLGTLRGFRTSGSLRVGKAALRSLEALAWDESQTGFKCWHHATFSTRYAVYKVESLRCFEVTLSVLNSFDA
jgi:hypothetical protein